MIQVKAETSNKSFSLQCEIERLKNVNSQKESQIQKMMQNVDEGIKHENEQLNENLKREHVAREQMERDHKMELREMKVECDQYLNDSQCERKMKNLSENNFKESKADTVDLSRELKKAKEGLTEKEESILQLKLQLQGLAGHTAEWKEVKRSSKQTQRWKKRGVICFRSYKCKLSNFAPCTLNMEDLIMDSPILGQIIIPGYVHPTTEHPYQIFKALFYYLVDLAENIRNAASGALAKELSASIPTDDRWHKIKWSILFMLTKEKLKQNPDIQEYLSSTGDSYLLEKVNDQTWGIGQDSMGGGNDMGNMWMLHRDNARLGNDNNPDNNPTYMPTGRIQT